MYSLRITKSPLSFLIKIFVISPFILKILLLVS